MDTRRRWFRFGLRTLFVAVTVCAVIVSWVVWGLDWIRQRGEFMKSHNMATGKVITFTEGYGRYAMSGRYAPDHRSPSGLWLLGEKGVNHIEIHFYVFLPLRSESKEAKFVQSLEEQTKSLFPEADVLAFPHRYQEVSPAP